MKTCDACTRDPRRVKQCAICFDTTLPFRFHHDTHDHANVQFNGVGSLVATRSIRPGDPLLANYTVGTERLRCPTCEKVIRGSR